MTPSFTYNRLLDNSKLWELNFYTHTRVCMCDSHIFEKILFKRDFLNARCETASLHQGVSWKKYKKCTCWISLDLKIFANLIHIFFTFHYHWYRVNYSARDCTKNKTLEDNNNNNNNATRTNHIKARIDKMQQNSKCRLMWWQKRNHQLHNTRMQQICTEWV